MIPTPRERLDRLRTRTGQEPAVPAVGAWWLALTGRLMVLRTEADLVWRAGRLVGIAPTFTCQGPRTEDVRWHRLVDGTPAPGALVDAVGWIGPDPFVLVPEVSAVGLVDARGLDASTVLATLLGEDVEGDDAVLLRRDLRRALWVSWDRVGDHDREVQTVEFPAAWPLSPIGISPAGGPRAGETGDAG